jgi:hypothetical protein
VIAFVDITVLLFVMLVYLWLRFLAVYLFLFGIDQQKTCMLCLYFISYLLTFLLCFMTCCIGLILSYPFVTVPTYFYFFVTILLISLIYFTLLILYYMFYKGSGHLFPCQYTLPHLFVIRYAYPHLM